MFGTLGYRDKDMLSDAVKILLPQLSVCTARDLCRVTHVYAQLHARHDLFFSVCAREISRRAHELQPHETARILHSYTRLRYFHPHLFAVLRRRVFENIKKLEPGALVLILSSLSRLRLRDQKLLTVLYTEVCRRIGDVNAKGLSVLANTYAEIGVKHPILYDLLIDEAYRKRRERKPQDVALMLRAIGGGGGGMEMFRTYRRSRRHVTFLIHLIQDIPRHIKYFTLEQVSMTAAALSRIYTEIKRDRDDDDDGGGGEDKSIEVWGDAGGRQKGERKKNDDLSYRSLRELFPSAENEEEESRGERQKVDVGAESVRIRRKEHPLLEALGDRVGQLSKELTPQSTAALVYAYAKLNYRHGPLLYHAPEHLERYAAHYSLDQLAKMCFAYSKLQIPNTSVLETTLKELPKRLRGGKEEAEEKKARPGTTSKPLGEDGESRRADSSVGLREEGETTAWTSSGGQNSPGTPETDTREEEAGRGRGEEGEARPSMSSEKRRRRGESSAEEDFCDLSRTEAGGGTRAGQEERQGRESQRCLPSMRTLPHERLDTIHTGREPSAVCGVRRRSQTRLVRQYLGDLTQSLQPPSSSSSFLPIPSPRGDPDLPAESSAALSAFSGGAGERLDTSRQPATSGQHQEEAGNLPSGRGHANRDAANLSVPGRGGASSLSLSSSSCSFSSAEPAIEAQLPGGLSPAFLKALIKIGPDGLPEEKRLALQPEGGGDERPKLHSLTRILQAMLRLNLFDRHVGGRTAGQAGRQRRRV